MAQNIGKVVQVIGPVVDVKFQKDQLPKLNNAIKIELNGQTLVVEVAQQLGDDVVRCIAMDSTDGLVRNQEAVDTGASIAVPVGKATLGRMFNVLGEPIDGKPFETEGVTMNPIHRHPPSFEEQQTQPETVSYTHLTLPTKRIV